MILAIADILSLADIEAVRAGLANATFVDGKTTAGWSAKLVKSNLQADSGPEIERLRGLVETRLIEHPVFALATRPKTIIGPLFSRYQPGHAYGAHVDDALIGGSRTDVSFTLFLADPDTYDGGELIIDTASGEEAFRLPAGSLVT
jgi:PKHD-type hydroxylase